jgi:RHS repeat-associated protein
MTRTYEYDLANRLIGVTDSETGSVSRTYDGLNKIGESLVSGEISGNSIQFTGKENDGTDLYSLGSRYYSPRLHRFIAEDPKAGLLCPEGRVRVPSWRDLNAYEYARSNPMMFVDRDGRQAMFPWSCPQCDAFAGCSVVKNVVKLEHFGGPDEQFCKIENGSPEPDLCESLIVGAFRECGYECKDQKGLFKFEEEKDCIFSPPI